MGYFQTLSLLKQKGHNMEQRIYIKAAQCIEVQDSSILLGDFLNIYCYDFEIKKNLESMLFFTFNPKKEDQIIISILNVIAFINKHYPNIEIENMGEEDILLIYHPVTKADHIKSIIFTSFICLVAFFGGGYAIMAYNTDTGAKELFTFLSMLFLGNATQGVTYLTITYSIGLTLGMILFFNHLGNKKIDSDPTPLEVQMRLYEQDLCTTIIKNANRTNKTLDDTN